VNGSDTFSSQVLNYDDMSGDQYPVILVHGWNSHPGIWKKLVVRLEAAGIQYWKFDHSGMRDLSLPEISVALLEYIRTVKDQKGWSGPADIVSHSMGTCIVRYLLEVTDRVEHSQKVRQLIGLGPPNNGSALADSFMTRNVAKKSSISLPVSLFRRGLIRPQTGSCRMYDPEAQSCIAFARPVCVQILLTGSS
jgi:triacylglycerol esterase/lipase EstA (alpha/beta hydrolase family)